MRARNYIYLSLALLGLLSAGSPGLAWDAEPQPAAAVSTTAGAPDTATGAQIRTTVGASDTADTINLRPQVTVIKPLPKDQYKRYGRIATQMAKNHWLDRAAAGDPSIIAAIAASSKGAKMLAQHPRIGEIADADHYLCRRITKWPKAAIELAKNPHVDQVIALDPEGIYRAIRRNPRIAQILAINPTFADMIDTNPDLGNHIANHL